jgi:hypothetical protein
MSFGSGASTVDEDESYSTLDVGNMASASTKELDYFTHRGCAINASDWGHCSRNIVGMHAFRYKADV